MLDHRLYTFLTLCETGNYTKTAEKLNMTQPAVTQHIQFLEGLLSGKADCRKGEGLFTYKGRQGVTGICKNT